MEETLQILDLKILIPSPTQPRKHFGEKEMQELIESVKKSGIKQPILVREWPADYPKSKGKYEIVDGERRYRASTGAGKLTVKALITEMSNEEVMETQMIGHLHRADLHPLEEADAYEKILAAGKYDAKELASKVGKSASHIYQRIALNKLIDEAKQLMWKDKLNAHQGLLIARCLPEFQAKILNRFEWQLDSGSVTASEIFNFIELNSFCVLKNAPFRTDDETLVPAAGSCAACPKRSGNNVDLFNDVAGEDTCTDKPCYDSKVQAHIQRVKLEISAKGTPPVLISTDHYLQKKPKGTLMPNDYQFCAKSEKGAVPAVVIAGSDLGKKKFIKPVEKEVEPSAPKISKEEKERIESIRMAQRTEIVRVLMEATEKHSQLSEDFWDHFAENRIEGWQRHELESITGKKWKDLNTVQKVAGFYLVEDMPQYVDTAEFKVEHLKFWKDDFGIDIKKIVSSVEKEASKPKAERPAEVPVMEDDAAPTGKARKSKLKKDHLKLNT
jgi:ParB/RepB/Spo0J family partition protein